MTDFNICRCCLSTVCYKDMKQEYFVYGQREVYSEMLKNTFNITVPMDVNQKCLICDQCITKLRSASEFKNDVMNAEKEILLRLSAMSKEFNDKEFLVKLEPGADVVTRSTTRRLASKSRVANDRKRNIKTIKNVKTKTKTAGTKIRSKIKEDSLALRKRTPTSQREIDLKENSLKLINNSNMCLFVSLKTKFRCYSCKEAFLTMFDLREHSRTHHTIKLRGLSYKNVDITILECNICNEPCDDLDTLKFHLTNKHDFNFANADHLLIPYKLQTNDFQCTICRNTFNTFVRLSMHMNKHSTNNVCEICGESFINRNNLRTHLDSMHREKKCSICAATFSTSHSRLKHMRKAHNHCIKYKRYCLLCNRIFPYTYLLVNHKIQEHGAEKTTVTCPECGKTFSNKQSLHIHTRSVHIRERNYACAECGRSFFTKCDLKRHENTHKDVRAFLCSQCEGRFKSKDSWRRHMKKQHGQVGDTQRELISEQ